MSEVFTEQEQIVRILKGWQFDRNRHASLYDRGMADSYYGRAPKPHYGGMGEDSGVHVDAVRQDEIDEYMAGYNYNEQYGEKKAWR